MNQETYERIKNLVETAPEYKCLREHEKVKNKLHMLCVSGSYAYGTNRPDSDIDIRGFVSLDKPYAMGVMDDWETISFSETDTVIYSYRQMLRLIAKGNPDAIVLLGNDINDYLYLSDTARQMIENHTDFIGAKGIYNSFIGYANAQLRRLELAEIGRLAERRELVKDKKLSILNNAVYNMRTKYPTINGDNLNIEFEVPSDENEKVKIKKMGCTEINVDDFFDVARDMKNITNSFGKKGKRNDKKTDFQLNKHCMQTVRVMLMGSECLETGRVVTNREKNLPLLKEILNGKYMDNEGKMRPEFYELVDEVRKQADYAYNHTVLPLEPDVYKISELMYAFILDAMKN